MKKAIMLLAAVSLVFLSGCGETSSTASIPSSVVSDIKIRIRGESTVMVDKTTELTVTVSNDSTYKGFTASISDENIATYSISGSKINVTGKKIGDTVLTVTSAADTSVSATYNIAVVANTTPVITITADKSLIGQNSALNLTASVADYQKIPYFSWKSVNSKGTLTGDKGAASAVYSANVPGSDIIEASFYVGEEMFTGQYKVTVVADHTGWIGLATAEDIKNNLLIDATIENNYYLKNDIDLGGYVIPYNGRIFTGNLDGQGYSISGFTVTGNSGDKNSNGGFFHEVGVGAYIMNIGFKNVEIGEAGSGWGTSVICCACSGNLENIAVSVKHTFDNSSLQDAAGWFPFNSAFVGIFKENSTYKDIVVNVETEPEAGYNTIFADVAYPAGGAEGISAQGGQTFSVDGFYTNSTVIGGSVWDWGSPVEDLSEYHSGLSWSSTPISTYDNLNSDIWKIETGRIPELKPIIL